MSKGKQLTCYVVFDIASAAYPKNPTLPWGKQTACVKARLGMWSALS